MKPPRNVGAANLLASLRHRGSHLRILVSVRSIVDRIWVWLGGGHLAPPGLARLWKPRLCTGLPVLDCSEDFRKPDHRSLLVLLRELALWGSYEQGIPDSREISRHGE